MELRSIPAPANNDFKLKIERSIWGTLDAAATETSPDLDSFFRYCQREMRQAASLAEVRVEQLDAILSTFDVLKSGHDKPRRDLSTLLTNQSAMDLSLRLMLMTGCSSEQTIGGDVFRPRWKEHESLPQYLSRVYPVNDVPPGGRGGGSQSLSLHKLSVDYLKSYADINIQWTHHLTDHLLLLKGSDWKTLYVFAHPAFILKSLETISDDDATNQQHEDVADTAELFADSLSRYVMLPNPLDFLCTLTNTDSRGCLPPPLLRETLSTLEILFPPVGNMRSQRLLAKEVARHNLDPILLQPIRFHASDHQNAGDVQKPTDVYGLYEQFPFWGARLQNLWAEAEEPTPTSFIGKLSDRKKSPRFMYWCGVLTLTVAVMFGIVSTILAALQVWISYCSWMGDVSGCGLKQSVGGSSP